MSYRSQVGLCLRKKDMDELKDRLEKLGKTNDEYYSLIDYADVEKTFGEGIEESNLVIWDSLKWYPNFPEVKCVEDYLDELDSNDIDYSFVRIGENFDDIEERSNYNIGCCDHLFLNRYIGSDQE